MPTAARPGPACSVAAIDPRLSASTAEAPPCSSPAGWVLPATGIVPAVRSAPISVSSMPMRSSSVPEMSRKRSAAAVPGVAAAGPAAEPSVSVMAPRLAPVTAPARPRLLLIDGHSMAYRAFFALPVENFSTTTGQHTNAVYGFTSMLINLLRDEEPTHVAVAFDVSGAAFRTEAYADYKANRTSSPEEFRGQIPLIEQVLDALSIPRLGIEGYEADDVLATLADQGRAAGMDVLICSGDRDTFQLIDERVLVLYPRKGVSDLARMDAAAVEERYGVPPSSYSDLAALVGESSDNLPGVPKVGPKTAAKWILTYGGLDGVIGNAGAIKGVAGENLRAHLDQVIVNRQVNRLLTDVALPVGVEDLERRPFSREQVHQVFDALEFRILRDRLFAMTPTDAETVEAQPF